MSYLIRFGDHSAEVADVQTRLRGLGFDVRDEPGIFGESTRTAVREFQQRRGLLVDGIVGPNTWTELVEASWRLGDRVLYLKRPYMRGDDVATLQARLNALGFDAGREDGIFGRETDQAVRDFQREYGVAEDGIFGLMTHAALVGLRVDRPGTSAHLREELRRVETGTLRDAVVVLDPGHGGEDPGTRGRRGVAEADACWQIASHLALKLLGTGGRVRFTRTETDNPSASERAALANEVGGRVFVSIHLNAHDEPTAEGASTYYFRTSRAGRDLAEKIQSELAGLGLKDGRSHDRSYTILRETRMPAVLVEPIFITNADEEKRLEDPAFLHDLADAIFTGIKLHFEEG